MLVNRPNNYHSILLITILLIGLPSAIAGNGVSTSASSGTGSTDSITNGHSSVSNVNNAFDSSTSSYSTLLADGDFSGNFGSFCASQSTTAYAEVLYTLSLQSNSNQTMTMSAYSQTEFDFSSGWSTVSSLKMTANVTDNGGTWNAWTSTSTNNSASPSPGDIDLGAIAPRSNNTIDVLVRIEHQGVFDSSCRAEIRVYDFSSDAVTTPNIAYAGSPFTFTKNTAISTITPTNTGGAATSWSISSGTLPNGLSFSTSTGAISGTPSAVTGATSITVQASNAAGSDETSFLLAIQESSETISSEITDSDSDGVADLYDECRNTQDGIEVGDDGCEISTEFDQEMDDGGILRTMNDAGMLIIIIIVLIGIVSIVVRKLADKEAEVEVLGDEWMNLLEQIQGKSPDGFYSLARRDVRFARTIDSFVAICDTVEEYRGFPEVRQVLNDMKKQVHAAKGAAFYLRGISTLVARIYRDTLKANGWKKPPGIQAGRDASGRKVAAQLVALPSRRVNSINKRTNPKVDLDFLKVLYGRTKGWDKILHPEEGIIDYSMVEMYEDLGLFGEFLLMVSVTVQNQPKRSSVEQVLSQNKP